MIEKLKKIIKQEDTVLFIGSGVSLWSGLPSWKGLISELIKFIKANGLDPTLTEQELKRGDLLQAASYGFDNLTKTQFSEFIKSSCRLGMAKPHEIHSKIISLGPNCYITTNYDNLLELSFNKWISEIYIRKVVNKQLAETAEIVGARSKNFLFKLHGDVEDSDSIILTREQYRELNIGGELYHALETVKTLMVSRPILYIGFGLRDPDFLYLKDLLINTYRGGTRDHYAIMPDVGEQEKDFWRRNFGIHIIDYPTTTKEDGSKDHSQLIDLLDELCKTENESLTKEIKINPEFILNLTRHAAKYTNFEVSKLHLPLIVHPIEKITSRKNNLYYHKYYEVPIEKLLDNGPDQLILIGLPGGGKSYSLKGSVARLANNLNKECLEDNLKLNKTVVPIYADLKLYNGDIIELLEHNIPTGLSLEMLCSNFIIKLYLDAFNEIPKEFIESNHWNTDFLNLTQKFTFSFVISSRTIDGLDNLDFPCYNLDSINDDFIKQSLTQNDLEIKGIFKDEVIRLLQKPFFYKLLFDNKFKIDSETSPQKIYFDLVELINFKLNKRFQCDFNLINPLSKTAMDAVDAGEEAFGVEILSNYLEQELKKHKIVSVSKNQIINWLISQNFLVPIIKERISFFHQSVTEYLAATMLAKLFVEDDKILKSKLKFRRWDQTLFLTLSLLDKSEVDKFLKTILSIDFELALSSAKYLENESAEVVNRLLMEIDSRKFVYFENMSEISHILRYKVPTSELHIPILKKLIGKGNSLGGSAVSCIINVLGNDFKNEALVLLVDNYNDYNFCTEIGRSIKKYLTEDDLPQLLSLSKKVQDELKSKKIKKCEGFNTALGNMMEGFNVNLVYETFFNPRISAKQQKGQIDILCNFLRECKDNEGLIVAINLLSLGVEDVVIEIYFILKFHEGKENIDYSLFKPNHIKAILTILKRKNNAEWALCALENIYCNRDDLTSYAFEEIKKSSGTLKAALYYSISKENNQKLVFESFSELLSYEADRLSKEPFKLIGHMDKLDWAGQEALFVKILKLRNINLATNICENLSFDDELKHLMIFDIGSIYWWLEWFKDSIDSNSKEWMFIDRVPRIISTYIPAEKRKEFIDEFNDPCSIYRDTLIQTIINNFYVTIEDFTEESISYMLEQLNKREFDFWNRSVLVEIATESFVYEHMIPRLENKKGVEKENLKRIIERIGKKHKIRYLV